MAAKALLTTKKIEIIKKNEFTVAVLDTYKAIFVVHIEAIAEPIIMLIYFFCKT